MSTFNGEPIKSVTLQIEQAEGVPKQKVKLNAKSVLISVDRDIKTELILVLSMEELLSTLKAIKTESSHARRVPKQQKRTRKAVRKVR